MPTLTNYARASQVLTESLNLRQSPVSIAFSDFIPEGIASHAGSVPAGCRFWEDAASSSFATSAADHNFCAIGVHTHSLAASPAQQTDLMDALKVFAQLDYVREQDVDAIPVLQSQPNYVIYSPLAATPLPPDVVLLVIDARQTLIAVEATQQVENQVPPALGRPACAVVPQVVNTGIAALSLGCCGARAYLDVLTDSHAIFAIPGAKVEAYADRIQSLARANGVLAQFHQLRRQDIAAGRAPTVKDSLNAMNN